MSRRLPQLLLLRKDHLEGDGGFLLPIKGQNGFPENEIIMSGSTIDATNSCIRNDGFFFVPFTLLMKVPSFLSRLQTELRGSNMKARLSRCQR